MAQKKAKITHTSTLDNEMAKNLDQKECFADYFADEAFMYFPGKDQWRLKLCYTLLAWSAKEDSMVMQKFFDSIHLDRETFRLWTKKYDDIKKADRLARLRIAARREDNSIWGKCIGQYAYLNIEDYDSDWIQTNNRIIARKKEIEPNKEITIHHEYPKVKSMEQLKEETDAIHK